MNNTVKELIDEMQNALFGWYAFEKGKNALVISYDINISDKISKYLCDNDVNAESCDISRVESIEYGPFDYFIIYNALEYCKNPVEFFRKLHSIASFDNKLFIATDNRLAIRYFCGDKDPFSGHVLDGIEGYIRINREKNQINGRCYSYSEIDAILNDAGLSNRIFYSVIPDIKRPQVLFAEDYVFNETLESRIFPNYNNPTTVFIEEEKLYDDLTVNGLLSKMAGGFLFECSFNNNTELSRVNHVTVQPDRSHEQSLATIIKDNNVVIKKPLYKEGIGRIKALTDNANYLINHGVDVIYSATVDTQYEMPYVDGILATLYFRKQINCGKEAFLESLKKWKEIIDNSSEHVDYSEIDWSKFDPYWRKRKVDDPNIEKWKNLANGSDDEKKEIGVILKRGYLDLVSLNCFYKEGKFLFFDQEFYVENLPANTIMIRTIDLIYRDYLDIESIYPRDELLKDLHLYEHRDMWRKKSSAFLDDLLNNNVLNEYHQKTRRNNAVTAANRIRMDYSNDEYNQLFNNLFKNVDCKKVYIFGSGIYSKRFVDSYGLYLNISGVLDNNKERWGEELCGVKIMSPDILLTENDNYKVIICIKYYDDVYKQLKDMGVKDISIYDSRLSYEKPAKAVMVKNKPVAKKKYHVGYVAGVFDLFHLGHVNLLKRAKEQCDYLIVGVVSDEQIINGKGTKPYMSFDERREIVESCKYVDEAVAIPLDRPDTEDAWRIYRFDVQFSGSDYENDPKWIAKREFLRERGSDLVFFPYTQSVSSTKLKGKIREQLQN